MKLVVLDGYSLNPGDLSWEPLSRFGSFECYDYTPPELAPERCRDADIVFANSTSMPAAAMEGAGHLKYIGLLATGYDRVDVATATRLGIVVTNAPGYSTYSVAQHAIALLLEITNRVGHFDAALRAGRWAELGDRALWDYPLIELYERTLGVIGHGRIGGAVAEMGLGLGMNVLATPSRRHAETADARIGIASLDEIYARADVISLNLPATPDTIGMINRSSLAAMKPGVIIINASRGRLIDEAAMAEALRSGQVFAYGADVTAVEPTLPDNPLLTAPNCYLTPHLGWVPKAARQRLMDIAADNLQAFLDGRPKNVVGR